MPAQDTRHILEQKQYYAHDIANHILVEIALKKQEGIKQHLNKRCRLFTNINIQLPHNEHFVI